MLTFDVLSPFIAARISPYLLGSHLSLQPHPYPEEDHSSPHVHLHPHPHVRPRVEMAAEHMVYREEELGALMPPDTVYVSSVRDPVNQLVSTLNYFQVILVFVYASFVLFGDF